MSKKNEATATVTTETTKTFPFPTDGSKAKEAISQYGSVSAAIRALCATHTRGEVAKMLGKRYQHVRNVMITPIKKAAS